jgi:ferritin-like metal-binding protein YciE
MPNATDQSMQGHPLRQLMIEELRDLYSAEKILTKALPKLAKNASSDELRELLETHLQETEGHVTRLEQVFEMLGERPRGKTCEGMQGIVEEGSTLLKEDFDGPVLDAGIIAGAQRSEHYEIAAYGSVMAWAKALGMSEIAEQLDPTLEEEKAADEKLSALAEQSVNHDAATMNGESDMDMMGMGNGMSRGNGHAMRTGSRGNGRSSRSSGRSSNSRSSSRSRGSSSSRRARR